MIWRIGFENEGRAHAAYMRYVSMRIPDIFKKQFFKAEEYIIYFKKIMFIHSQKEPNIELL
jgi:hypothetical protein